MKVNFATISVLGHLRAAVFTLVMGIGILPALPANLRADVLFTSITGPCCGGHSVAGSAFGYESLAAAFVPSLSESLGEAEVVVFAVIGFHGDPHFDMALFSSVSGAPGSRIEQLGTGLTAPAAPGGIIKTASNLHPGLLAGTQYWLVLTPLDHLTDVGWEEGGSRASPVDFTAAPIGMYKWDSVGGPNPDLQFQIDGIPEPGIPEPGSLLLFATVVGTVLLRLSTTASRRLLQ